MKVTNLFLALAVSAAAASSVAAESRNHYFVVNRNNMRPAYEVTRIHDEGARSAARTFLIADAGGPLLRVDAVSD